MLGHVRLAIVDIEGGHQPMRGEDASFALVCNGEIYNHRELREALTPAHRFGSRSDSEVVLHLYEDRGAACVHQYWRAEGRCRRGAAYVVHGEDRRSELLAQRDRSLDDALLASMVVHRGQHLSRQALCTHDDHRAR